VSIINTSSDSSTYKKLMEKLVTLYHDNLLSFPFLQMWVAMILRALFLLYITGKLR